MIPLEDAEIMAAADPTMNGFRFSGPENQAREREMSRRLLTGGPLSVVILGGAHNLYREIKAECQGCASANASAISRLIRRLSASGGRGSRCRRVSSDSPWST